jgi:fatty-acyl-CoA synthase
LSSAILPLLRNVVLLGPGRHAAMFSWSDLTEMGEELTAESLTEREGSLSFDDPLSIQFTSGTTGSPKGVVLSHYNIVNNARLASQSMSLGAQDRICLPVPFFHCFGMVLGSVAAVLNGAAMVLPGESFDAASTLEAIAEERCTAVYGVPTMFIRELEHPRFAELDLGSLRTGNIGGAPCPPALVKRIIEEMHCPEITIGYGLTEASPLITQTTMRDPETSRLATVGRVLPHTEVKIVDVRTKEIVDRGLEGELCVRGYGVMGGYYKDEAATRAIIDEDGWLHTGDVATMDEDGYFRIVGRIKDVIIRGGEKIHPREVEDLLITHSAISEAHVVGVPDAEYGERVAAWVKPEPGCSLSPQDVVQFCRGKVAAFKIPGIVRIVNEFPTTLTGKIQKFRIREIVARELVEGETSVARTV